MSSTGSGGGGGRHDPGSIIEVFADGRIAVDLGRNSGVSESTRLVVVESYDDMTDAGGESLGRIMNPKVYLSVYSVDERFCVTYPVRSFVNTLRAALPFLSVDRSLEPKVGDEVVFADDWVV